VSRLVTEAQKLMLAGEAERAVDLFDRAKAMDRSNLLANRGAVRARITLKRYKEALSEVDDALTRFPTDKDLHEHRGDALAGLGRWPEAAASYQRCIEPGVSGYWEPWLKKARAEEATGDLEAAKATYRDLLHHYPGHVQGRKRLEALESSEKPNDGVHPTADPPSIK
jgi:tetratricopeptide (TPR) repeat protein